MNAQFRVTTCGLYFLPIQTRVPLRFGAEVLTEVTCARVRLELRCGNERAVGWGETPLSVQWVWPSTRPYRERHDALREFAQVLVEASIAIGPASHPLPASVRFQEEIVPGCLELFNGSRVRENADCEPMPWLAALVAFSPFDLALHDAFGKLRGRSSWDLLGPDALDKDLAQFLDPAAGSAIRFDGLFPRDFLRSDPPRRLRAWHLVGGLDPLTPEEVPADAPRDGVPLHLADWIRTDGLRCLKVKLKGTDAAWDFDRLVRVGSIGCEHGVEWLSADFNCTVRDPAYVNEILDRLRDDQPRFFGMLLYVEQPFPYDLKAHAIDAHSVAARKPLFLDESAHDWRHVRLGRSLGWNGVALKTCKTLSGALLSAAWARAHGMALMVQDLTNPMLAQIPHLELAARAGTIMGVETNSMQFYPEASEAEARVHPGAYRRRDGCVDLSTIGGPGLGYRIEEIRRELPPPVESW